MNCLFSDMDIFPSTAYSYSNRIILIFVSTVGIPSLWVLVFAGLHLYFDEKDSCQMVFYVPEDQSKSNKENIGYIKIKGYI